MAEKLLVEAVNDALHVEMERDADVMVLGEDVGRAGGVFRATAGLRDRFGADRCVDTPLAEAGILGSAVGLCMAGFRPVCEMQYDAFSYPCLDQLITHVGRYRWRTGGKMTFPLTIRMPYGGGVRAPELHDDSPETYYVHTPGIKVAIPSTPADAKGLLAAAIRDPDPVVILEPKLVYRTERGEVPEGEHVVPLGKARLAREGGDLTLVAYGAMVPVCERAADELEASVEVLDLRSLEAARRGGSARVGREDRPRRPRPGSPANLRLRRRARGDPGGEGAARPARPRAAGDGLRRAVPVLDDRGRVHAFGRAGRGRGAAAARVLGSAVGERLRLWLERGASGFYLRDAATGEPVRWEDPRIRVVPVAGVSYRIEALEDPSFDPGRRLALVPEPENEHDPNAVGIWNEERALQLGYVPAAIAPELAGDEQALSLWRVDGGRVLIAPRRLARDASIAGTMRA